MQKSRINVPQPYVVQKYYQYMAGVDQFDGFLNNMHPGNGWKKCYWMQMINFVQLLQVGSYYFYDNLDQETSQLDFLKGVVP